jgi:hypothetical protein
VRKLEPIQLKAWMLPLIVIAVAVPIVVAFTLAGPGAGLAVGALAATVVLVLAARARFDEPIEVGASPADRYMLLVVVTGPIDDPKLAGEIAEIVSAGAKATGTGSDADAEVLVLAPALNTRVAHWLSDLRKARFDAQHRLAVSLATLAAAGLDARAQVGDSDPVQAIEDTLRSFPAQEVVFVTSDAEGSRPIDEVRRRLDRPVRALRSVARAPERERST